MTKYAKPEKSSLNETMLTIKQQNNPSSHYKSRKTQPQQSVNKEENEPHGLPIDFVTILPFEIIFMIFEAFPTETLFMCMDVSPGWQHVLQKCPSLWEEIILENELNYNKWIPKYYPLMGMHIKSYTISKPDQGGLDLSVEQILEGSMNNLTSLAWNCGNVCDIVGRDILKCLRQLRHSLISLELSTDADLRYLEGFDIPPLAAILSACPTLKRLEVTIPCHPDWYYEDALVNEYPSTSALTHLIWSCDINLTKKDTQKLFTACPSLVYAQFDSTDEDDEEENITTLLFVRSEGLNEPELIRLRSLVTAVDTIENLEEQQ
ncbi:hypothetical protein BDA99DRAFT_575239 [Phascolomyces articulosus]|uniref:F-box domain-containing protein n=1 Tax=Phascolomyces articulosus TaxID=60185 RepID=A0AAD5PAA2_9FUNG|nr:hypothetical protein BDA99DRAFT_575239 [Phascolomyces articulosus]